MPEKVSQNQTEKINPVAGFISKRFRFLLSPFGFLCFAAVSILMYLTAGIFGLREYSTLITGTLPDGCNDFMVGTALGGLYFLSYFAFMLAVPVLIIGATILIILAKLAARPNRNSRPAD